jgi:hypothetical protein
MRVLAIGRPIGTVGDVAGWPAASSCRGTAWLVDQTVVSVGP